MQVTNIVNGVDSTAPLGTIHPVSADPALARFRFVPATDGSQAATTARRSKTSTAPDRRTSRAPNRLSSTPTSRRCCSAKTGPQRRRVWAPRPRGVPDGHGRLPRRRPRDRARRLECTITGDLDLHGFLGLDDNVRPGVASGPTNIA